MLTHAVRSCGLHASRAPTLLPALPCLSAQWKALASPYGNGGPDIRNAFAELQPQLAAKWPGSITHEEAAQGAQGDIGGGVKLKGYNGNTPRIEYQSSQIKISDLKGKPVSEWLARQGRICWLGVHLT